MGLEYKGDNFYYRFVQFKPVKLSFPILWQQNPYKNRYWRHDFLSLRWLSSYLLNKNIDAKSRSLAGKILSEFLAYSNDYTKPYWEGLGDHTTILRMRSLIELWRARKGGVLKLSKEQNLYMQRAIRRHAARLASDGIYIENSNHGLMVDQALMDLSLQVPEFDRDLALYKKGADRFRKQILGIFDNAGFTKEHSISYQWYNAIVCQRIIDDHPSLIDEQSLELFEQQIAFRTLVLMEASKESDGCYLALGESSYEFPERHRLKLESLLNEEQKRNLSLIRHNQVLRLFIPQAGFYFDKNDCYHFSLTIGRHSTVHKQDDDGSFTYSIKNRRVLIDPGYSAVKANLIYKSDKQHNTAALIDDSGTVASFVASAESAASVQEFSDRVSYTFVLKGINSQLQRIITIRNDCFFEVEDSVLESSVLAKNWALEQRFCLAPDIEVSEVAPSFLMFKGQDNIPFMFCRLPKEASWSLVNDGIMAHDESPKLFKRLVVVSKDRSEPARVAFRPLSADVNHGWIVREPNKKYPLGESVLDSEKNAMCFYRVGQNIEKLTFGALFAEPPKANHIIGSDVNVTKTKDDVLLISPSTMCPKLLNILSDEIGQLQRNENFKVRGNAFVKEGGLCLGTFKQVKFSDWNMDPFTNRTWKWRLHWLSFISYIIAAITKENAELYLNKIAYVIESWFAYAKEENKDQEFVWHDQGTALRLEQVLMFLAFAHNEFPEWFKEHIVPKWDFWNEFLNSHGTQLADDGFYSRHTNHGLEQVRVLLLLGYALNADQWLMTANQRLEDELTYSFGEDGVHVENSPAYHVFVFKIFIKILGKYPAEVLGDSLRDKFTDIASRALIFLANILRPDGKLPILGDTEELPITDGFRQMFGRTEAYEYLQYSLSAGVRGKPFPKRAMCFKDAGWVVIRNFWPEARNYRFGLHLIFKAGSVSSYHRQEDDGSLVLMFGNEDWLIDSGMYNYNKTDPIRKYMRSRAAHNVMQLRKAELSDTWKKLERKWNLTEIVANEDAGEKVYHAELDVYKNVYMKREVHSAGTRVKVVDTFKSLAPDCFLAACLWHIPLDKKIEILSDKLLRVVSKSGRSMIMAIKSDRPFQIRTYSGSGSRIWESFVSRKFNHKENSQVIVVDAGEVSSWELETSIHFSRS